MDLKNLIPNIPEDVIKDAYKDGVQPALTEAGKGVALIPQVINAALVPVRKWVLNMEYSYKEAELHKRHAYEEAEKLLALKLQNVDPEKIVPPEPYVAVPALQAISYSMDNEELRELYANLLAKSMYIDTKDSVHPSFVEMIKQMSPLDANVLKYIYNRTRNPIIRLRLEDSSGAGRVIIENIIDMDIYDINELDVLDIICLSLDNLKKMNLLSIDYESIYEKKEVYDLILNSRCYKRYRELLDRELKKRDDVVGRGIRIVEGNIDKTSLGKSFYKICIEDI